MTPTPEYRAERDDLARAPAPLDPSFEWRPATVGYLICRRCGWWSALIAPNDATEKAMRHSLYCRTSRVIDLAPTSSPLQAVIGRQIRAIRDAAGVTAEQVSTAAKAYGLGWTRSKVADLERGAKPVGLEELLLLPLILRRAGCPDVTVPDLLPETGTIALSSVVSIDAQLLQRWIGKRDAPATPGLFDDIPLPFDEVPPGGTA